MPARVVMPIERNRQYLRVVKSYRNASGMPTTKILQTYGQLEKALKNDPDVIEKAKLYAEEYNKREAALRERNRLKAEEYSLLGIPMSEQGYESAHQFNIGVAVYYSLAKKLSLPIIFKYVKTKSRIRYDIHEYALLMVLFRLVNPASKLATWEDRMKLIIAFHGANNLRACYRTLSRIEVHKDYVVAALNRQISKLCNRDVSTAYYDVTTYAFESQQADTLRIFGMSKDHKSGDVQVVLGLLMDQNGIPMGYELFPGNTSEFSTLIPVIEQYKNKYNINKITVVADRGLNSNENLTKLSQRGCKFIMAQKIKNSNPDIQEKIFSDKWDYTRKDENGNITYKAKFIRVKKDIYETKISEKTKRRYTTKKVVDELDLVYLVTWSLKRYRKDKADQQRAIEKAQKAIASGAKPSKRGFRELIKYDQEADGKASLDNEKIEEQAKWHGYYAITTNDLNLSAQEIEDSYHGLWQIEDCFRVSKTFLEFRPCYVWRPESVRGHFLLCYVSLVLEKLLAFLVKKAAEAGTIEKITPQAMMASLGEASVTAFPGGRFFLKTACDEYFDQLCKLMDLEPIHTTETRRELGHKLDIGRFWSEEELSCYNKSK